MNTQPHSLILLIYYYANLVSTIQQEEVCPGFALADPVEVPVVAEEEIVSFLRNKVEEAEEIAMKEQISHVQIEQTVMNL